MRTFSGKNILLVAFFLTGILGRLFFQPTQTLPMGWNSYNCFGSAVHEDEVKANADYIAANLKQYG